MATDVDGFSCDVFKSIGERVLTFVPELLVQIPSGTVFNLSEFIDNFGDAWSDVSSIRVVWLDNTIFEEWNDGRVGTLSFFGENGTSYTTLFLDFFLLVLGVGLPVINYLLNFNNNHKKWFEFHLHFLSTVTMSSSTNSKPLLCEFPTIFSTPFNLGFIVNILPWSLLPLWFKPSFLQRCICLPCVWGYSSTEIRFIYKF